MMPRNRGRGARAQSLVVLGLVGLLLTSVACTRQAKSVSPLTPAASAPQPAVSSSPTGPVILTESAPNFTLTVYQGAAQLGGDTIELAQLKGKSVVLNFYAGNCPPCRQEMPDLEAAYQQYRDKVVLVGVDIGPFFGLGTREEGKQLLSDLHITYPAGTTIDKTVPVQYQVLVLPSTVSLTPDGKILRRYQGALNRTSAYLFFEELVRATSKPGD